MISRILLVATALFSLIALDSRSQKGLSNELIWNSREFSAEFVGGLNSMNDGLHYTSVEESDAFGSKIVRYSYITGKEVDVIATSKDIFGDEMKGIEGYEFSADEKQLLIQTKTQGIYRYSFSADYYVYNLTTKKTFPLTDFAKGPQMLADFSPDGKRIAFVRNNNLFVLDTKKFRLPMMEPPTKSSMGQLIGFMKKNLPSAKALNGVRPETELLFISSTKVP
jgi:dipeptidyl-peptidase 4